MVWYGMVWYGQHITTAGQLHITTSRGLECSQRCQTSWFEMCLASQHPTYQVLWVHSTSRIQGKRVNPSFYLWLGFQASFTIPLACYPCLLSSKQNAVCMEKVGVDLIKLYDWGFRTGDCALAFAADQCSAKQDELEPATAPTTTTTPAAHGYASPGCEQAIQKGGKGGKGKTEKHQHASKSKLPSSFADRYAKVRWATVLTGMLCHTLGVCVNKTDPLSL